MKLAVILSVWVNRGSLQNILVFSKLSLCVRFSLFSPTIVWTLLLSRAINRILIWVVVAKSELGEKKGLIWLVWQDLLKLMLGKLIRLSERWLFLLLKTPEKPEVVCTLISKGYSKGKGI